MRFLDLLSEPSLHVRTIPGRRIQRSRDGAFLAVVSDTFPEMRLAEWADAFESANSRLNEGAPLAELRDCVLANGNEGQAAAWLARLDRLRELGSIEFPLVENGEELAVIAPQQESFVPSLAPRAPDAAFGFHRFACLRRDGAAWLAESPLSGARFRMADPAVLDKPLVRRALAASGFLEDNRAEESEPYAPAWEFHDLIFHSHSRRGWHHDPSGPQCPYIGLVDPEPVRRTEWPGTVVELPRADESAAETCSTILERRRSDRDFDDREPISIAELGGLLDRAARSHSSVTGYVHDASGKTAAFEGAKRPYPSSGAVHELEIYPVVHRCKGLDPGLYHYDSWRHVLVGIPASEDEVARLLRHARIAVGARENPQIVLTVAARFSRVFWKYKSIGYGNILRNTGALYQTLYLAATELGLAACAVGSADAMLFARITGLDPLVEGSVGDFAIGSRRSG